MNIHIDHIMVSIFLCALLLSIGIFMILLKWSVAIIIENLYFIIEIDIKGSKGYTQQCIGLSG